MQGIFKVKALCHMLLVILSVITPSRGSITSTYTELGYSPKDETNRLNTDTKEINQLRSRQEALEAEVATLRAELQELKSFVKGQNRRYPPEVHSVLKRCKYKSYLHTKL